MSWNKARHGYEIREAESGIVHHKGYQVIESAGEWTPVKVERGGDTQIGL